MTHDLPLPPIPRGRAVSAADSERVQTWREIRNPTWSTRLAQLLAAGISEAEAAEELGQPIALIRQLLATPEFKKRIDDIALIQGNSQTIENLLASSAIGTIVKLLEHRDSPKENASLQACKILLDRQLGKVGKGVNLGNGKIATGTESIDEILRSVTNDPVINAALESHYYKKFRETKAHAATVLAMPTPASTSGPQLRLSARGNTVGAVVPDNAVLQS